VEEARRVIDPAGRAGQRDRGRGVFAVGGFTDAFKQTLNTAERYDSNANRWRAVTAMPTARGNLAGVSAAGAVYAIGGFGDDGAPLATVESYDPATHRWRTDAPLPTAAGAPAAAAHGGRIYVVGGGGTKDALADLQIYRPSSNTWTSGKPMPTALSLLSATWSGGHLYAIGGVDGNGDHVDTVEAYDPHTDMWQAMAPLPRPTSLAAVGTLSDGRIVAAGGCCTTGSSPGGFADAEIYTPSTDSWQKLTPLPEPRGALTGAVVRGNEFLVIGGFKPGQKATGLVESTVVRAQRARGHMRAALL
jgi:N-acetylneuraminic acid mutarotase